MILSVESTIMKEVLPWAIQLLSTYPSTSHSANNQRMGMLRFLAQKGFAVSYPDAVKLLHQSAGTAELDAPQGAYVFALLLAGEFNGVNIPENILPRNERLGKRMLGRASSLGFSHAQCIITRLLRSKVCHLGDR